jgi:raffinose/stachyose/melibiose transport system permease protein
MFIISLIWILPLFYLFLTALKSPADFYGKSPLAFPSSIRWINFVESWEKAGLRIYIKNSLIISIVKVPLGILIEALAAFALTRLDFKYKNGLFIFFLVGMMIPMQVTLVPLNKLLLKFNLINTYTGIIIVYFGFGLSYGILIMRGFMRTIPIEIDESAKIDGCNNLRLFWNIILPIAKPAVLTLLIMDFLHTWNEFLLASLFLTKNVMRTVPTGLMVFFGQHGVDYTLLSAAVLISIIPILVVFLYFQKYFVKGLAGAVKG